MTKGFAPVFWSFFAVGTFFWLSAAPLSAQQEEGWNSMSGSAPFDEVRKSRPPRPTGEASHDQFPSDFLTLSVPAPDEKSPAEEPGPADRPKNAKKADSGVLLAVTVALALFGFFTWSDYRYRTTLQSVLARNRRLIAGEALDDDGRLPQNLRAPALAGMGDFSSSFTTAPHERRFRAASEADSLKG